MQQPLASFLALDDRLDVEDVFPEDVVDFAEQDQQLLRIRFRKRLRTQLGKAVMPAFFHLHAPAQSVLQNAAKQYHRSRKERCVNVCRLSKLRWISGS